MNNRRNKASIYLETAHILSQRAYPGKQFILRVAAPSCAATAKAGQFAHLQCDPLLAMRRPLSIMRANAEEGWVEFLFKIVGRGTSLLSKKLPGEEISLLGPIGTPFNPDPNKPRTLLLGGGVGMPPMIFLSEQLHDSQKYSPLVLLASEVPFPFSPQSSKIAIPGIPEGVIASMPLLEEWGIPSRLASRTAFPGCFNGYITDLARNWLRTLDDRQRDNIAVFGCGPHAMLEATAKLAHEFNLPCQISLEEYMACAVGGCAGCVVEVTTATGTAMKRVCVDGPVFDAHTIFTKPVSAQL